MATAGVATHELNRAEHGEGDSTGSFNDHELAHHIHYWLSDDGAVDQEAHGPEFMACHISILDTCRFIPVVGMRAICGEWRVRYADPGTGNSLKVLRGIVRKP